MQRLISGLVAVGLLGVSLAASLGLARAEEHESVPIIVNFREPDESQALMRFGAAVDSSVSDISMPDVETRGFRYWELPSGRLWYRWASGYTQWRSWDFVDLTGTLEELDYSLAADNAILFLQKSGMVELSSVDGLRVVDIDRDVRHASLRDGSFQHSVVVNIRVVIGRTIAGVDMVGTPPAIVYIGANYEVVGFDLLWREVTGVKLGAIAESLDETPFWDAAAVVAADQGALCEELLATSPRVVLPNYPWSDMQTAAFPRFERWAAFSRTGPDGYERALLPVYCESGLLGPETDPLEDASNARTPYGISRDELTEIVLNCGPYCL